MLHVTDDERRRRLAVRHALAPGHRVGSPEAAARAMTVLHATEPATVFLSCWARCASVTIADIDRALYDERSLVKQLAMRRTVFVFPRDLLGAVWPSASARVARTERAQMARDVVAAGIADDGDAWLDRARAAVREDDVVWWLGATKGIVRAALAELGAVAVTLDSGATGWLLPARARRPRAAAHDVAGR